MFYTSSLRDRLWYSLGNGGQLLETPSGPLGTTVRLVSSVSSCGAIKKPGWQTHPKDQCSCMVHIWALKGVPISLLYGLLRLLVYHIATWTRVQRNSQSSTQRIQPRLSETLGRRCRLLRRYAGCQLPQQLLGGSGVDVNAAKCVANELSIGWLWRLSVILLSSFYKYQYIRLLPIV